MTVMSSFWRYLFVGIALMVWPTTWPVGSYHCIARYWLHGYAQCLKRKRISVTTYIQVCMPSNVCLQSIYVLKYRLISTLVSEEDKPIVYSWLTLQQSAWPTVAFACCSLSILFPSRDQSVVFGVMTDREPTVLSGCLFACENVCDIRAIGAYAYQC